jgi:hypothetical protein
VEAANPPPPPTLASSLQKIKRILSKQVLKLLSLGKYGQNQ